ncbi:MAG: adenylate/guanylate cyclase domain-containing protein [Gammaproteobacteria bacterium]
MQSLQGVADMLQKQYQRKLTVIVSADVAGYARLTELNEIDVHSLLKKRLKLVREHISSYNGQVLRIHGDGCLCSFDSTISALKACLDIQQNSNLLNSSEPVNNQIWFRIGVHLSEVIMDESEPYGKGVNIAVRLQQKAEPGEILISKKTIQSLDDMQGFLFSKFKKLKLKNISNSVAVCKLLGNSLSASQLSAGILNQSRFPQLFFAAAMVCLVVSNIFMVTGYWRNADTFQNQVIIEESEVEAKRFDFFTITDFANDYEFPKVDNVYEPEIIEKPQNNPRLLSVIKKVEALSDEFRHLRDEISSDDDKVNQQIAAASNILSRQEQLLDKLLEDRQQDNYMSSSLRKRYSPVSYMNEQNGYLEFISPDYVVESLDSLNQSNHKEHDQVSMQVKHKEDFGCLSCVNNKHINRNKKQAVQYAILNKTAVLVGGISGDGAHAMKSKAEIIEDYLYTKLQSSIQQSRLGTHIDQFTRLSNNGNQKIDDEYLQSLCNETKAVLVASYELITNHWAAEGTYLRFHHCGNHKSMVLLEKNLAPTIMNVQEPYLTDDALQNVDKSVDYMIDKLVLNQTEYL